MNKFEILLDHDSIMISWLFIFSLINIYVLRNELLIFFNFIILFTIYFIFTNRIDKLTLLISLIIYSLFGIIFESFIINSKQILKYNLLYRNYINVPIWLFFIYMLFALFALHIYKIITHIIN